MALGIGWWPPGCTREMPPIRCWMALGIGRHTFAGRAAAGRWRRLAALAVLGVWAVLAVLAGGAARAGDAPKRVEVVIDAQAPALERAAAEELAALVRRLFGAEVVLLAPDAERSAPALLVGSPATNPAIAALDGFRWPDLGDEGLVIKSLPDRRPPRVVVGGGSPAATLWAVYELGAQWGVRYLLSGDVDPAAAPPLDLAGFDLALQPAIRTRAWQAFDALPIGLSAWSLKEQQGLLGQLAKHKLNRIVVPLAAWQPFFDFSCEGIDKRSASLWRGWEFPIPPGAAGRSALGSIRKLDNPELAAAVAPAERSTAAVGLVKGIIEAARRWGMSPALGLAPLEIPSEFSPLLRDSRPDRLGGPTVGPGDELEPHDPRLLALLRAQLEAALTTYPEFEAVYLWLPREVRWTPPLGPLREKLLGRLSTALRSELAAALEPAVLGQPAAGAPVEGATLGTQLAALELVLDLLGAQGQVIGRDGSPLETHLAGLDPRLYRLARALLPAEVGILVAGGAPSGPDGARSTAARAQIAQDESAPAAAHGPAAGNDGLLVSLAAESTGPLPRAGLGLIAAALDQVRSPRASAFLLAAAMPGDLDAAVAALSAAAWDEGLESGAALERLVAPMCGPEVAPRVALALEAIDRAAAAIERNDSGFARLAPALVMQHEEAAAPPPAWLDEAQAAYVAAMNEMYRAHDRADPRGRPFLRYYCKRLEFAVEYLAAVQALRRAGSAGEADAQFAELEQALESMYNALSALGEVARDPSDRGAIAVLNVWGYHPLEERLAEAEAELP